MEDLYSILIVVAGIIIAVVRQKQKQKTESADTSAVPMPEPWPVVEPVEEEPKPAVRKAVQRKPASVRSKEPNKVRLQHIKDSEPLTMLGTNGGSTEQPDSVAPPVGEAESEYTLRTPEEARRAFIYSEIFQRKY